MRRRGKRPSLFERAESVILLVLLAIVLASLIVSLVYTHRARARREAEVVCDGEVCVCVCPEEP